jgi:hypothetical protein
LRLPSRRALLVLLPTLAVGGWLLLGDRPAIERWEQDFFANPRGWR